jgi:hypothetical protein
MARVRRANPNRRDVTSDQSRLVKTCAKWQRLPCSHCGWYSPLPEKNPSYSRMPLGTGPQVGPVGQERSGRARHDLPPAIFAPGASDRILPFRANQCDGPSKKKLPDCRQYGHYRKDGAWRGQKRVEPDLSGGMRLVLLLQSRLPVRNYVDRRRPLRADTGRRDHHEVLAVRRDVVQVCGSGE